MGLISVKAMNTFNNICYVISLYKYKLNALFFLIINFKYFRNLNKKAPERN